MSRQLSILLRVTDYGFLLYWLVALLDVLRIIALPPEWMYAGYGSREVFAWNWSFFPLDVAFALCGLKALSAARKGQDSWRAWALISLVLTMTAGGMAIAYWVLLWEFDVFWITTNLLLLIWPLFFIGRLIREISK